MAHFYLVCGISGGGKTVLGERIVKKNPNIIYMDTDEYYGLINGDPRIHKNTFDVWIRIFQDLHKYEVEGKDVLLTTNSLTVAQRRQFIEWFPTFEHHMLWVTAPKERCLEGNRNRFRNIPEDILLKFWEEMEFPNASEEGWETIAQITNCWDHENYIIFNLKGDIEEYIEI